MRAAPRVLLLLALQLLATAALLRPAHADDWLQPVLVESLSSVESEPVDRSLLHVSAGAAVDMSAHVGVDTAAAHAALLAQTVTAEGKTHAQVEAEIAARAPALWDSFKATFKRRYADEAARFRIFTANLMRIAMLNARTALSTLPNRIRAVYSHLVEVADLSEAEFRRMLGVKANMASPTLHSFLEMGADLNADADADADVDAESEVDADSELLTDLDAELDAEAELDASAAAPKDCDWRSKSSPIRNQGQCGSCWAHSAVATLETAYNLKNAKKTPPLSVQSLLDCMPLKAGPCDGGQPASGLLFLMQKTNGSVQEAQNPYQGKGAKCKSVADFIKKAPAGPYPKPADLAWALPPCQAEPCKFDEDELGRQLNTYGALSVNVDASQMQFYKSGVIGPSSGCSSERMQVNHAVNLEGLGTDKSSGKRYWIVRNSWSDKWGEKGRFRLEFGKNTCAVATWAVRASV